MQIEDLLAILSLIALVVIFFWMRFEKKKLFDFFNNLTDEKKGKAH